MPSKICLGAVIAAILIVGAAIASSANAAPPDDACSLLTQTQVSAALGASVAAGSYVAPTFTRTCTWNATTTGSGYVTLMLQDVGAFESGKQLSSMAAAPKMVVTPIGGVGDDAYYLALGDQVGFIVKKGNVTFKVAVYAHIPIESKQAKEKTLAQQVISALQQ